MTLFCFSCSEAISTDYKGRRPRCVHCLYDQSAARYTIERTVQFLLELYQDRREAAKAVVDAYSAYLARLSFAKQVGAAATRADLLRALGKSVARGAAAEARRRMQSNYNKTLFKIKKLLSQIKRPRGSTGEANKDATQLSGDVFSQSYFFEDLGPLEGKVRSLFFKDPNGLIVRYIVYGKARLIMLEFSPSEGRGLYLFKYKHHDKAMHLLRRLKCLGVYLISILNSTEFKEQSLEFLLDNHGKLEKEKKNLKIRRDFIEAIELLAIAENIPKEKLWRTKLNEFFGTCCMMKHTPNLKYAALDSKEPGRLPEELFGNARISSSDQKIDEAAATAATEKMLNDSHERHDPVYLHLFSTQQPRHHITRCCVCNNNFADCFCALCERAICQDLCCRCC